MKIDNRFNIEQPVYLKTDTEQKKRLVTAIKIMPGCLMYELSCSDESSLHYDFEITVDKDVIVSTTN